MPKYGNVLLHNVNSILVEVWYAFKVSSGKFIRESFVKKKLRTLITTGFDTNTQACVVFVQVSYGSKSEEINGIEHCIVAHVLPPSKGNSTII